MKIKNFVCGAKTPKPKTNYLLADFMTERLECGAKAPLPKIGFLLTDLITDGLRPNP